MATDDRLFIAERGVDDLIPEKRKEKKKKPEERKREGKDGACTSMVNDQGGHSRTRKREKKKRNDLRSLGLRADGEGGGGKGGEKGLKKKKRKGHPVCPPLLMGTENKERGRTVAGKKRKKKKPRL